MYNGQFIQNLEVSISCKHHDTCLMLFNIIKKQCEAWYFCVKFNEHKGARKGPVLQRSIMISQTAYASDIVIFKEAIRRVCFHLSLQHEGVKFIDRGSVPVNDLQTSIV